MVRVELLAQVSAADVGARAIRRIRRRLIPFLALLYFIAYLDRVNVGFAALQMNAALGLSPLDYGRGAGIFFLGYFLFEVPSNLALARIGARIWIARIAIVWGFVSMATMFAVGPRSFNAVRFLLGAAEAGFFPGIVFYFTYWFPARERARAMAQFSTASMAAGIVGAPLSGVLLSLGGAAGLGGWQWLFLVEGLPAVVLGVVAFFYLDDGPERASWLPDDERQWVMNAIQRERSSAEGASAHTIRAGLLNPAVWRFALVLFLIVTSGYGFSFFLPQIVKRLSGASDLAVGLWTAVPFTGSRDRDDHRGSALRSHRGAAAACRRLCGARCHRSGCELVQRITRRRARAPGRRGRGAVQRDAAVLVFAHGISPRRRRGGGHRPDQLDRQSRRICWTVPDGMDAGPVR
jgi:ACS family tartrate transporter-like MFS transporter